MKLTTFTDYGLRMLIYVAIAPGGRATVAEVARAYAISENHLVKVAHVLGRGALLANVRGRGGGLRLARPAGQINVGASVRLLEGEAPAAECFDEVRGHCAIGGVCALKGVLAAAVAAFHAELDRHTLADITHNTAPLARALGIPLVRAA